MNDRDWSSMSEKDFDAMLEGSVSETPPEDVVEKITPWKKAMNRVLAGMALCDNAQLPVLKLHSPCRRHCATAARLSRSAAREQMV